MDASACTAKPCDKLVVVFSGGEQGCATGAGYAKVLAGYASQGYAAACINYFETSTGSGRIPYADEATRLDLAVRSTTAGPWARRYWSGEYLLLQGISHGATAPLVLMARTKLEEQKHWQGTRVSAGCFFDGSYDQLATATLLERGAPLGKPCTFPVPYTRWLERYCGAGATKETCDLATQADAQQDTITGVEASRFALGDFRLFECGSAVAPCSGDILPAAPIKALCTALEASADHRCTFTSLPTDGHLTCHQTQFDQCRTWFDELTAP